MKKKHVKWSNILGRGSKKIRNRDKAGDALVSTGLRGLSYEMSDPMEDI